MHELSFHKALSAFEKGRAYQVKTGLLPGMLEPVEPEDLIEEEEAVASEIAVATKTPEAPGFDRGRAGLAVGELRRGDRVGAERSQSAGGK